MPAVTVLSLTNPDPVYSLPYRFVYRDEGPPRAGDDLVEFRLTYQGKLTSSRLASAEGVAKAENKHDIRRHFHKQLRKVWGVHPSLKLAFESAAGPGGPTRADQLAAKHAVPPFRWLPLVRDESPQHCSLQILYLRNGARGYVLSAADIDNRIKTLIDALRIPKPSELPPNATPSADEAPFFVLLEDDNLVTHLSVETDMLLDPFDETLGDTDSRVVIFVRLWSY